MYPNNIINHKFIRFVEVLESYAELKDLRLVAKKNKDKLKDLFYKLILNGISGLLDMEHSWLYYNEGAVGLRMTGQLQLLRTCEELKLHGFEVLTLNTDGLEVRIKKEDWEKYKKVMNTLANEFNLKWEHDRYDWMWFVNINNYIAKPSKYEDEGILYENKIKEKGLFVEKPELGNSVNFLIIPKVLRKHLDEGIPIKELIINWKEHGFHIYDFCASMKVDKSYEIMWNNEKQQNLNRFYACRNGAYLYKKRKGSLNHLLKDSGVCIFNKFEEREDYGINYNFYIGKINEILIPFVMKANQLF